MLFVYSKQRWYSLVGISVAKREEGIEELEQCQEARERPRSLVDFLLCHVSQC